MNSGYHEVNNLNYVDTIEGKFKPSEDKVFYLLKNVKSVDSHEEFKGDNEQEVEENDLEEGEDTTKKVVVK